MNVNYPMDATPEEIYAIESGKNIKLRFSNGIDIIERYLDVVGVENSTRLYSNRKITYKNAVAKGIGNNTETESKYMPSTTTANGDIFHLLRILRRNGYVITHPKKEKRRRIP